MILTLGKKCLRLQTKFREGTKKVDAFDYKSQFFVSDIEYKEIEISEIGYIFQPSQIYLFAVGDARLNHDSFFNPDLKKLGVKHTKVNELQFTLQFSYPVKLYQDTDIFID